MAGLGAFHVPLMKMIGNAPAREIGRELFDEIGRNLPKAIGDAPGTAKFASTGRVGFLLTKQVPPTPYFVLLNFPLFPRGIAAVFAVRCDFARVIVRDRRRCSD